MARKVIWTYEASADLEAIAEYIARDSEYYAERTVEKIIIAVEKLDKFLEMGRSVPIIIFSSLGISSSLYIALTAP